MKDNKLISMVDFVQSIQKEFCPRSVQMEREKDIKDLQRINFYSHFLRKPLKLGMFVPTDLEGNVLEEPKRILYKDEDGYYDEVHWEINTKEYQQAKERVLFKEQKIKEIISGVYKMSNGLYFKSNGEILGKEMYIESITELNLTLTQSH